MSKTDFTKPTYEADKQEALDLWQQQIAYAEKVYNGTLIRWRYWVGQMPQLSSAEAARLMSALDPDLFANLDNRPNKNDPSKRCERAAVIQRLAERKGMQVATPAEWLAWAVQEGFVVHDGFRLAVESTPAQSETPAPRVADDVDFAMLATRTELIDAFGKFTGMDKSWFDNLTDTPRLMAARKFTGQGGRKNAEPLFCPYEVMQWLADPKQKKCKPLSDATAWRLLKSQFSKVYNRYSIGDPNAD